jgi:maleate isomerase
LRRTAEFWLEKPVVAINTATYRYRYAPRQNGVDNERDGFGSLLSQC